MKVIMKKVIPIAMISAAEEEEKEKEKESSST
jgi:hypothetical protein